MKQSKNEPKAVLFDLDDTLFDHRHSCREGLRAVWKRYTCFQDYTIDEFEQEHIRLLEKIHFSQVLVGKLSIEEARAERFKHAFINKGVEVDFATASNAAVIYRNTYQQQRKKVNGAEELLKRLKGRTKIGIVTNNLVEEQQEKLKHIGFEGFIDELVTSEEVGAVKPEPEIFLAALERLNAAPHEVVMIGDSWNNDIAGAHRLGIKCVWLNIFGVECPDPSMAAEIKSLEDTEHVLELIKL